MLTWAIVYLLIHWSGAEKGVAAFLLFSIIADTYIFYAVLDFLKDIITWGGGKKK